MHLAKPADDLPGGDEAALRLLGAVFRRARFDAERGSLTAQSFLVQVHGEISAVMARRGRVIVFDPPASRRNAA